MKHPLVKAALVVLVSVLPHLFGIRSSMLDYHHNRQINTAAIARNYHENGLRFLHPQIDWDGDNRGLAGTEFPLYMYLVGLFWGVGGLGDLWGRILSVLFSAMTALALWRWLIGWIGERPAFLAALLFPIIPVEVYFGRTVQPEALAMLCTVLSFWMLDIHLTRDSKPAWAASWIFASLAIGHKLPYAYLLGVLGVLACARKGRAALRDPWLWALLPMIIGSVFAWYKYASSGTYVVPTSRSGLLSQLEYSRILYYAKFQVLSRFPEITVTWAGMAFWATGAWCLWHHETKLRLMLWGYLACVFAHAIIGGAYMFHHEYTALPYAPVNAAFMGVGLDLLLDAVASFTDRKRTWAAVGLVVLVISFPVYTLFRIKHWYRVKDLFLLRAGAAADAVSSRDDLFLCNEWASSTFPYYLHRRGWSVKMDDPNTKPMEWIGEKLRLGGKFLITRRAGMFEDAANPLAKRVRECFPAAHEDPDFLIFRLTGDGVKAGCWERP